MPPRTASVITLAAACAVAAHTASRRAGRTWGATYDEARRRLPGDDLVPVAGEQVTMAVTVDAPPHHVWPWLLQMGLDHAGFYLVGNRPLRRRGLGDNRVHPAWQGLAVGDRIWFVPDRLPEPRLGLRVAALEPNRYLVCTLGGDMTSCDGTWQLVLEPQGECTRLLFRSRASAGRPLARKLAGTLLEPASLAMDARMLRGIARRAAIEPLSTTPVASPTLPGMSGKPMTAVVAVASAQGATRQVAWSIAAGLRAGGVAADIRDLSAVTDLAGYDVVVVGSAIHTHHWLPEARRFVERHQRELRLRPVWLFSSGMLTLDSGEPWPAVYPEGIDELMAMSGAHGHRIFTGRRSLPEPKALWKLFSKGIMWYVVRKGIAAKTYHLTTGDYRDWDAIRGWAEEIVAALRAEASRPAA